MAEIANNDFFITLTDLAYFMKITPSELSKKMKASKKDLVMVHRRACVKPLDVREILEKEGVKYQHRVISFQMLKGGVAKTTSALNFAIRANMYGARVLVVDLDQQANISFALGVEDPDLPVWVDVVEDKVSIEDAILEISESFHLLPSNLNNSVLDRVLLNGTRNLATSVSQRLKPLKKVYDLIVIDTAPNLSAINTSVACASDLVILPVTPDRFSLSGLSKTMEEFQDIRREFRVRFQERILFTKFDAREGSSRESLRQCHKAHGDKLMETFIRTSSEVKNQILSGRTLFDLKSKPKEDYDLMTRELMGFGVTDSI